MDPIFATEADRQRLETEWLPSWLRGRRWFGGKDREIRSCRLRQWTELGPAWVCAVEVQFAESLAETYLLPLMHVPSAEAAAVVAAMNGQVLVDATHVAEFRAALFRILAGWGSASGIVSEPAPRMREVFPSTGAVPPSRVLSVEQSNTSLVYGDRLFVKWFRKLEIGENPDVEMLRFLGKQTSFTESPAFFGALGWAGGSLAVAIEFFPDASDGWALAMKHYKQRGNLGAIEEWQHLARVLGEATGRMHVAFASDANDPAFRPEPVTPDDVTAVVHSMLVTARDAVSELPEPGSHASAQSPIPDWLLREFLAAIDGMRPIQRVVETVLSLPVEGVKIRVHGDYHLGQVLATRSGFKISDFEGEPLRPLPERRRKQPPARDVAGMLRSLSYVAGSQVGEREAGAAAATGDQRAFFDGWRAAVSGTDLSSEVLMPIFLLEKAFYELRYELRHRPDWAHIPMTDLISLCRSIA